MIVSVEIYRDGEWSETVQRTAPEVSVNRDGTISVTIQQTEPFPPWRIRAGEVEPLVTLFERAA